MSYHDMLREHLRREEGVRASPYDDATGARPFAKGNITIGVGRNLDAKPLSPAATDFLLDEDIRDAIADARAVLGDDAFDALSDARKVAICDMAFNLGRQRLEGFKNMLAAVREGRWSDAADEMVASHWASQVGSRAAVLERAMRDDVA